MVWQPELSTKVGGSSWKTRDIKEDSFSLTVPVKHLGHDKPSAAGSPIESQEVQN